MEAILTSKVHEMEGRLSGTEDKIEEMDTSVQKNVKSKTSCTRHPGNQGHYEKINLRITGIGEGEETWVKDTENIFN